MIQANTAARRRPIWVALIVAATAVGSIGADNTRYDYPPAISLEETRVWIDKAAREHPRLLANRSELAALRKSLGADPLRQAAAEAFVHQAGAMIAVPPITRKLQGRRLLGESRRCIQRVLTLSLAYHLTGQQRYLDRAKTEMLAVARFSDWNPKHFLDVAEMTFALAIGYDWLYDGLDDTARREIRSAIVRHGVSLPFETRHKGWVKARNNWGQVCHGGLVAGALAVLEDEPDLAARTVHNALRNVTYSMAAYAPRGGYPEGPGYWSYGTSFNVLLIGVLESALGTDFGLSKAPGFAETGQFPSLACGPSGLFFNYADGGDSRGAQPVLFWFARRFERPDWLLGERDRLQSALLRLRGSKTVVAGGRLLPLVLLWMPLAPQAISEIHMPLHWQGGSKTPIAVHRSSWTDRDATFIGLKGGSPSASHGQMDIGSFVLDADGRRWATDLGAEGYHGIESRGMNLWSSRQNSDRWTIFRQSNHGHNTLVIDDQLQRVSGHGKIVDFAADPAFPHSVVDLSSVYAGQARSVCRGVALLPSREVLVQDQLVGLKPGSRVRWGMITRGTPGGTGKATIELRQQDARLRLSILSPIAGNWRVIDTAKPRHEWDSPNHGTCMLAFETVAPPSGELTLAVLATPGSCDESLKAELQLRSLDEWKEEGRE